ncbi:MAG: neuraminidase-like domain-containing protein, partial [Bacteroidota bacterium]
MQIPPTLSYILQGQITDQYNAPVPGLIVRAFDKDPNTPDNPLGVDTITSEDGKYAIAFTANEFTVEGYESGGPELIIRVFSRDNLLGESRMSPNSKRETTIDLQVHMEGHNHNRSAPLVDYAKILNLKEDVLAILARKNLLIDNINEAALAEFVNEKIIDSQQKDELILVANLAHLSGENVELVGALKAVTRTSTIELVSWDKANWLSLLKKNRIAVPKDEIDAESYAENLREVVEKSFPTEYFLHRTIKNDASVKVSGLVKSIAPLFKNNEKIIAENHLDALSYDWNGISEDNKRLIEGGLLELSAFVNTYRALGVADILNQKETAVEQKQVVIEKRFGSLNTFYTNNPAIDLQQSDFSTKDILTQKDAWNWKDIDAKEQPYVKKQMSALQRTFTMGGNHEMADALLKTGFDSASAIVSLTEKDFLAASNLDTAKAKNIYSHARETAIASSHYYEAIRDVVQGSFKDIGLNNQSAKLVNDLREIDGYDALFGSQDFCDCDACKSILSPAAYFTDLMYFTQEHVSKQVFIPAHIDHPLYLKNRRPDLWTLKLSCQNTSTELPYLQVVNEVLESYLIKQFPGTPVYDMLLSAKWSCRQPFNLVLEEIRLFLSHFDLSLDHLYKMLNVSASEQYREKLKLSKDELPLVSTPDPVGVRQRFGNIPLNQLNLADFIRLAGISRSELDDLLQTKFVSAIATVKVNVVQSNADIQVYEEKLTNLTDANLDLIHRYIRLWKKTDWSLREFDLILNALKSKGNLNNLEQLDAAGNPKVLQLAAVITIQKALNLSSEEMATLIYQFPQTSIKNNQKFLYERIFDLEKIFGVASVDANGVKILHTQATLPADKSTDKITSLLLAGLSVTQSDLEMLFNLLSIDRTINQVITVDVLSTLYRHASIARGLKITMEDFVNAINLTLGGLPITQLAHIDSLIGLVDWMNKSPFSISEIMLIVKGKETSQIKFAHDLNTASAAVIEIQKNATNDKKDKLELLKGYLQSAFNLTQPQLIEEFLLNLVSVDITGVQMATALNAAFVNGKPVIPANLDGLVKLMRELECAVLLFGKVQFDADKISFYLQNKAVFGISDFKSLTIDNIANAVLYHSLLENNTENAGKINEMLLSFQANALFSATDNAIIADLWKQPESLIISLTNALTFTKPALKAISYLKDCHQLCLVLGIQGDALLNLIKTSHVELKVASNIVAGAFASKYEEEKVRVAKLEPFLDKLNTLKRNALCDYIISRSDVFKFKDRADLYNFFLLDVDMSGCFRTSRLVAAITSLQHYLMRCLINLEQSSDTLNPKITDLHVKPDMIPADEWEWRKNYRVWEANRKVFLYPENYIDPTLRDTKTAIFKELEDALLQQKITKESSEAAYKKYIAQFSDLTRLRYAGGYFHQITTIAGFVSLGNDANNYASADAFYYLNDLAPVYDFSASVFYIFARTNVQPYQYYYRTYNHTKKIWANWEKIELGIEASEISTLILHGKLYIYWTDVQSKEINSIKGGESQAGGFLFKTFVKYSILNENGKWSAPQRVYIGQNHVSEPDLFQRIWKEYPNDATRDKTHDFTLAKYQERVFRKPYAVQTGDKIAPVSLYHIWSHNKTLDKKIYTTGKIDGPFEVNSQKCTFSIASVDIAVTNNDFDLAVYDTTAILQVNVGSGKKVQLVLPVTIHLINPVVCVLTFAQFGSCTVALGTKSKGVATSVNATKFDLSLSRNLITNPENKDILDVSKSLVDVSLSSFKREYDTAYEENQWNKYYVENGSKDFSDHFIRQAPQGQAGMHVVNGKKSEPVLLSTILTDELADILFADGIDNFLSLPTQKLSNSIGQQLDFRGPYGEYYWEMFFHIPFLIADHLNANQKFKEAKWWYERIFNPTADENPNDKKKSDHNWQFREFRNLDIQKLKDLLTESKTIEAYKNDPFNPHAIARLRLSAYQKTVVMRYIDNLLDWGDYLFGQDTRESINEAEMLYQLAADILGKRPAKTGKCETLDENELTYEKIGPQIKQGSEFLITLENYYHVQKQRYVNEVEVVATSKSLNNFYEVNMSAEKRFSNIAESANMTNTNQWSKKLDDMMADSGRVTTADPNAHRVQSYREAQTERKSYRQQAEQWKDANEYLNRNHANGRFRQQPQGRMPAYELVKQNSMVFCVPPNTELIQYWDRVDDRLFKIRNCMNIKGIRRSLSLFQPPIDPMLLVRARAAGLSLEDITALLAEADKIPLYRFTYLVEKARQYVQTLQGFGSSLLSALEKKDGEELSLLRLVHEKNILKLTKDIKKKQVQEAQYQYKATQEGLANVQNRIDYYQGLIETGLISWEVTEQVSKWTAGSIKASEAVLGFLTSAFGFMPQIGSPFAMKYGGVELKNGTKSLADATGTLAAIADNIGNLAGMEASHQRREQEWKQQLNVATQEYKQMSTQLLASDIRQQMAERDFEIHEKNMEQAVEHFDFYKNKFTNLGLYNYMSSTLNRLYRDAYNMAYDLAKMAERAYQNERFDAEIYIQNDNWQFDRAGLLSGERLMLQLQNLEKKFLEKNERVPEISQTFSMAMLSPSQLLTLRQTGACSIVIPEIAFEALYPGQYRRIIKSVRISIPCVAGPYTNISAKLTLEKGYLEKDDSQEVKDLNWYTTHEWKIAEGNSITVSSANNDSGVFDLNFRDERYLPFEGAGAISEWKLELPKQLRSFNYDTISDVLLHINYTALEGNRDLAETKLKDQIKSFASGGLYRLISLRSEFPNALHTLLSQSNQVTTFDITKAHFPYLLQASALELSPSLKVYLKPKKGMTISTPVAMRIDGLNLVNWSLADDIPSADPLETIKGGTVTLNGAG